MYAVTNTFHIPGLLDSWALVPVWIQRGLVVGAVALCWRLAARPSR